MTGTMTRIRLPTILLALALCLASLVAASWPSLLPVEAVYFVCPASRQTSTAAPTFCKCTCFTNSTIIPLGPQGGQNPSPPAAAAKAPASKAVGSLQEKEKRAASSSCTQCNRAFCLNYNLPICKGAEEKDVVTSCFQRDSRKDQIIVWGFILGTAGLLGWAGLKRVLELRETRKSGGSGSLPLGSAAGSAAGGLGGLGSSGRNTAGGGAMRRSPVSAGDGGVGSSSSRDRGMYSPLETDGGNFGRGPG
ncbi:hypothetical protein B0H63DRAFT_215875 [Podospora didyma]|uniref:Uncharacterized protein n=1 Tax=Podospora didyma TaxID=330526 RepID=A0AAE0TWD3_9PEZI|nr:hypothetical protein B0H63DRAFT_215875 [Podospora didyma]